MPLNRHENTAVEEDANKEVISPQNEDEDENDDEEEQQSEREDELGGNTTYGHPLSSGTPGAFRISNSNFRQNDSIDADTIDANETFADEDSVENEYHVPHASVVDEECIDELRYELQRVTYENTVLRTTAAPVDAVAVVADREGIELKKKKICIIMLLLVLVIVVTVVVLVIALTSKPTSDPSKDDSKSDAVETSSSFPTNIPMPIPTQHPTSFSAPSSTPTLVLPYWSQLGQVLKGQEEEEEFANVALNAGGGNVLAVGAINAYNFAGAVRVYKYEKISLDNATSFASNWTQLGSDVIGPPSIGMLSSKFGGRLSLAKDGMVMAASAPFHNFFQGVAHVYRYSYEEQDWIPYGNTTNGVGVLSESGSMVFGIGISLSGDGMKLAVNDQSFARVYGLTNGRWEKVGQDITDEKITSVDLSEDGRTLAVQSEDLSITRVYSLNENNKEWVQIGNDIVTKVTGLGFIDLSADAKTIAISDLRNGSVDKKAGSVIVKRFDTSTGNWTVLGPAVGSPKLLQGDFAGDDFGSCISLSADGNRIVAGARNFNNTSGLVRVLDWDGEQWIRGSSDIVGNPNDQVGFYCSLAESRIALGSPTFDTRRGFAYVLERKESNNV